MENLKRYGIKVRNCAGTTIYDVGLHSNQQKAFEAAKKGYAWFTFEREPDIKEIVES